VDSGTTANPDGQRRGINLFSGFSSSGCPDTIRARRGVRKRVEEIFGWGKSVASLRRKKLKGRRRTWNGSYLIMAAYNLTRMTRLLRPLAT